MKKCFNVKIKVGIEVFQYGITYNEVYEFIDELQLSSIKFNEYNTVMISNTLVDLFPFFDIYNNLIINVNLVYQYMNATTGEISLDVQFTHVKVAKKSHIQDVIDLINRRLRGTDCSVFPILGNYSNDHFSVCYISFLSYSL